MYEKLVQCPVCDHTSFTNDLICTDYSVSGESFALVKCEHCQLVFTNPRPKEEELNKYYKSQSYISHSNKANSLINIFYKLVRTYTLRQKLKLVQQYVKNGSILDYGCGTGHFLNTCQKSKWLAFGLEPDVNARRIALSKSLMVVDSLEKIESVDVITAWHVLEHVSELRPTLANLASKLKETGFMFIAVPNLNSFDANHYKEYWAAYDVPRHLYHFSQNSFQELLHKSKLKLVKTIPMKLDSFYVSMLSEKYKYGQTNYVRAFKTGRKSNIQAVANNEYSSLIYIVKK